MDKLRMIAEGIYYRMDTSALNPCLHRVRRDWRVFWHWVTALIVVGAMTALAMG